MSESVGRPIINFENRLAAIMLWQRMKNIVFQALAEAARNAEGVALGIISGAKGSSPQKVGAKALFYAAGVATGFSSECLRRSPGAGQPPILSSRSQFACRCLGETAGAAAAGRAEFWFNCHARPSARRTGAQGLDWQAVFVPGHDWQLTQSTDDF